MIYIIYFIVGFVTTYVCGHIVVNVFDATGSVADIANLMLNVDVATIIGLVTAISYSFIKLVDENM